MRTLVKVGKGDHVAYSYSDEDKTLRNVSVEVSQKIEFWVPPSKCLVHWDDNTTKSLDDGKIKLLGVPSIGTKLKEKYENMSQQSQVLLKKN